MAEVTDRDPLATRICILEEYKSLQEYVTTHPNSWRSVTLRAHKYLKLEEDYMNYPEFEFWFLKFLQGNFDLEYNRSSYPKARSLTDLPLDILEQVGENLTIVDRFQLRNVCKGIRAHVDNWKLKVGVFWYYNANEWAVWQTAKPKTLWEDLYDRKRNSVLSLLHRSAVSFLMSLLKLPKLRVEKLEINKEDEYWKKLIRELDRSNRKLHVKKVEFPPSSKIDLHFMVPGVLEEIKMFLWNPTREEFSEIIESEQCQKAKMVYIESPTVTSEFPLEALYNCPRFILKPGAEFADDLNSRFLKTLMKKGRVQKCVLYMLEPEDIPYFPCEIMKYFKEPEAMVPNCPSLRRYPIPGTNEYYELEYRQEAVHLERKS